MASFNKFAAFITDLAAGDHANILNAATDTIKVYLTNNAPSATGDSVKADLAGAATGNGYTDADIVNTATTSGGTITIGSATGVTWTATGGPIGPVRYAVIYNDTATGDPLIGWWDRGSSITATAADSITVDFGTSVLTLS